MTPKERMAVYLAADGRSEQSGAPLDPDKFHLDHVIPKAAGGPDEIGNVQVLTPEENLAKSCRHVSLRRWQASFLKKWTSHALPDFLLAALPAGGKTIAALACAEEFLDARIPNGRIIVVVPSDNLRTQWKDEAHGKFGIELATRDFHGHLLHADFHGCAVTFHSVASQMAVFQRICAKHPTFVIFDEIHHAGDENTWGDSIRTAFAGSVKRLAMSGTVFRSDGTPIPFIEYDGEGFARADFRYDYPEAIQDTAVRLVSFHSHKGTMDLVMGGNQVTVEVNGENNEDEARERLRLILRPGNYTSSLLRIANERLNEIRKVKPDAGALALAIDSCHALQMADQLKALGESPSVVLADTDKATSTVDAYRQSTARWLVAVRQVSEGTDIKRLMVLAYLTNTVTEMFFRQAIGRIMRNCGEEGDGEAYTYMPDDPRLNQFAKRIEDAQVKALLLSDREEDERAQADRTLSNPSTIVLGTTDAIEARIITCGEAVSGDEMETVRKLVAAGLTDAQAVKALPVIRAMGINHPQPSAQTMNARTRPVEDLKRELQGDCQKAANRLARVLGCEVREIHAGYKKRFGKGQDVMSLDELKSKLTDLRQRIAKAP